MEIEHEKLEALLEKYESMTVYADGLGYGQPASGKSSDRVGDNFALNFQKM